MLFDYNIPINISQFEQISYQKIIHRKKSKSEREKESAIRNGGDKEATGDSCGRIHGTGDHREFTESKRACEDVL